MHGGEEERGSEVVVKGKWSISAWLKPVLSHTKEYIR